MASCHREPKTYRVRGHVDGAGSEPNHKKKIWGKLESIHVRAEPLNNKNH